MIVIGIGSTTAATVADVLAAIRAVERQAAQSANAVATLNRGAADTAIIAASDQRGIACHLHSQSTLAARNGDCVTQSPASLAAHGIASVAEAAALAAAGPSSRLIVPRQQFTNVTAAVAASQDNP